MVICLASRPLQKTYVKMYFMSFSSIYGKTLYFLDTYIHTLHTLYGHIREIYITVIVSLISFFGLTVLLIKMLMDWDFYILNIV